MDRHAISHHDAPVPKFVGSDPELAWRGGWSVGYRAALDAIDQLASSPGVEAEPEHPIDRLIDTAKRISRAARPPATGGTGERDA